MASLSIFAGPTALNRIRDEGLNADQFKVLLAASGGPKWFVLYGLDRYLFGKFFAGRETELITLGSSAGAWRISCLGTSEPVAAIERLARLYSREDYSSQPTTAEITDKARAMLSAVLGADGAEQIINNAFIKTHIITDRCKGFGSSPAKPAQILFLILSAVANLLSRRNLSVFFERTVFSNMGQLSPWASLHDLDTSSVSLSQSNIYDAMIASGSIPFVLDGVRDIDGAKPGLYWDGGITDYHFDLPFHQGEGLVLYPHFSVSVIPGWFDKHLPWRKVDAKNFHNVVMLVPSKEFVASLPYGKIPDRSDFKKLDYPSRIDYWQQVLDSSQLLADEFSALVDSGHGIECIQPFEQRRS